MEETKINIDQEYIRLAKAYTAHQNIEIQKENTRKDIELLLDVLGCHTTTTGYNESSSIEYTIPDNIDRGIITKKLLSKIELL